MKNLFILGHLICDVNLSWTKKFAILNLTQKTFKFVVNVNLPKSTFFLLKSSIQLLSFRKLKQYLFFPEYLTAFSIIDFAEKKLKHNIGVSTFNVYFYLENK